MSKIIFFIPFALIIVGLIIDQVSKFVVFNNEVNFTNNDQNIKLKEIDNNHNEEFKVDNINLGNDINEKNDEKKNKITREDNNKKEKMEINNNNFENTNNDINKEEIDNI